MSAGGCVGCVCAVWRGWVEALRHRSGRGGSRVEGGEGRERGVWVWLLSVWLLNTA